jgi:cell division protein FtsW (lipid II flippase)
MQMTDCMLYFVYANSYYIFAKTVLSYGVVAGIAIILFLSYGGSATLTYAVFIGLLMSCHRYERIVGVAG